MKIIQFNKISHSLNNWGVEGINAMNAVVSLQVYAVSTEIYNSIMKTF